MQENTFTKDITINKFKLDEEWLAFPNKVYYYTKLLSDAIDVKNKAKENMDMVEAELYLVAKSDPTTAMPDIPANKVTETTIGSWIKTHFKYKEAVSSYLEAVHDVDILRSMVNSLDACKGALSNAVSLWLANYFSTPKIDDKGRIIESAAQEASNLQLDGLSDLRPKRKK